MEFGLKGMSRLVADVTGSRHSGLGFILCFGFLRQNSRECENQGLQADDDAVDN